MRTLRLLLGALTLVIGASAQAAAVLLSQLPGSVAVGSAFSVNVRVNAVSDLYAFQLDLSYSQDILRLDSIQEGLGFQTSGGFFSGLSDPSTGIVSFISNAMLGPGPGKDGDIEVVTFVFTAFSSGIANFNLSNVTLLDSNLAEILPTSVTGGQTVVTGNGTVPEPNSVMLVLTAVAGLLASKRGAATVCVRRRKSKEPAAYGPRTQ